MPLPSEWFELRNLINNARYLIQCEKNRPQPDANIIWRLTTQMDRWYAQQAAIEVKYPA